MRNLPAFRVPTVLCSTSAFAFSLAVPAQEQVELQPDTSSTDDIVVDGERHIIGNACARSLERMMSESEAAPMGQ